MYRGNLIDVTDNHRPLGQRKGGNADLGGDLAGFVDDQQIDAIEQGKVLAFPATEPVWQ